MTNYNFIEKLLCGRPIADGNTCTGTNGVLGQKIAELQTDVQNLEREKQEIITGAGLTKKECLVQIDALNVQITGLNTKISELNAQLNQSLPSDLQTHSSNFYQLPVTTQTLLDVYMNKYPEGFVEYNGRYWGSAKTRYNLDVKAWLLEGQNDWRIVSMVKSCKGRVSDVLKENPGITFHEACDIAFMRVTNALCDSIQYTYDATTWGSDCAEFWQFASETRTIAKGDCEDKAVLGFVSGCIAGIPFEMMRLVAGMTVDNQGHATLFYFASDAKFHHRNSTTNYPANKDPKTLPLTGDDSEPLNIKTVWFSATQNKTFTNFDPTAASPKEKKDGLFKFLKWR